MKSSTSLLLRLSSFYFKEVWKEVPFIVIVSSGLGLMFALILIAKGSYEAQVLPTTYEVLRVVRRFQPVLLILLTLYSGELIAKDRIVKISPLIEVLPYPTGFRLATQVLAMSLVLVSLLLLFMLTGIVAQLSLGFYQLNIGLYIMRLFTEIFFNGLFIIALAFFVHTLVNHKFVAHAVLTFLILAQSYLASWGLEHRLFHYAKLSLGPYSDLVGLQINNIRAFIWYTPYWAGFGFLFYAITQLLVIRGIETGLRARLKRVRPRLNQPIFVLLLIGCVLILFSAVSIYKNTIVINGFKSRSKMEQFMASYEKQFKPYEGELTPEITRVKLHIDLFPSEDRYNLNGVFSMVNSEDKDISQIYVQGNFDQHITTRNVDFDREFQLLESSYEYKNAIYQLNEPLKPGDSLQMSFNLQYDMTGFAQIRRGYLAQSASFFSNDHLPELGYRADFELRGTPTRARYGLKPRRRERDIDDPEGYTIGLHHGHNISYEALISTDIGHWATTSGTLQKQWSKDGRAHFHYKTDSPIENQYIVLTGALERIQSSAFTGKDSVIISLFHHPSHTYNLDAIMHGLKASVENFSHNFSPYQYDHLNLLEIPRIHDFAISIPNTIALSEAMGFVIKNNQEDLNIPFYITAHEVAHQWWGDQVRGARVQGESMIVETLAHYSAGIVTLQEFGEASTEHIIRYERGRYLKGRKRESHIEQPLWLAEDQPYIHYGKGLISMMALRHYISEDSINKALRRLINDFPAKERKYPNSRNLLDALREVTPDSLQYLVSDLFEKIIFVENGIPNASVQNNEDGSYTVKATFVTEKYEADAKGVPEKVGINDWIEVAVYTEDGDGELIIYKQMHHFDQDLTELSFDVTEKPTRVVIDPLFLLMDRNLDDNVWKFK